MKFPLYLSDQQVKQLKYEHVSDELKIYLTRKLEKWAEETSSISIYRKNRLINDSRTISGGKIYVLQADDMGDYLPQEGIYHDGEFKLILRRLSTVEFVEFISPLIIEGILRIEEINALLLKDGASFFFDDDSGPLSNISVSVIPIEELEKGKPEFHKNIRLLVNRMNVLFDSQDFSGVLHASASIFEVLAKDIINIDSIENQGLGSFFERYKNESSLPSAVLDYVLEIYKSRNTTPLAGHGQTNLPDISKEDAIVLIEMTKAFVAIEYRLRSCKISKEEI